MTGFWQPPYRADYTIARGSSGGGSQSTTQQVILPGWLESASEASLQNALNLSTSRTYQQNPNDVVQPLTDDQTNAYQTIRDLQGNTNPYYAASEQAVGGLLGDVKPLTAQGVGADATSLMNPYTDAVVDPAVALMRQQLDQSLNTTRANAANVGAFGGSRQGVQEGVAQSQEALQAGALKGGLLQQGYGQALSTATDIGKTNLATGMQAATLYPQLAQSQVLQDAREAGLLENVGRAEQGQAQATSDLAASQWQDQFDFPLTNQAILEQALTSTPYGGTSINTGPAPTSKNKLVGAAGGALAGASAGAALGPYGAAAGAIAGGLLGAFG